jgi:sarcosine oxidase subunit alpha
MSHRLAADAAHNFGGIALDRNKPLQFRLDGHKVDGFAGDTVLSALLASGIDTYGRFGEHPLALTERFAPLARSKDGPPLPIDRLPAVEGADLSTRGRTPFALGRSTSLNIAIDGVPEVPWLRADASETLATDLLIVGGGITGLAAAEAATKAGHSVILVERRPWLGGDARYFGAVGDEASPETVTNDLIARLTTQPGVTILTQADVFAIHGSSARVHRIVDGHSVVVGITAKRIVLATGSLQRLPIFSGNRLPRVMSTIGAYHLAKRYGVAIGHTAIVATQSNYGYRLAMRINDAGVAVRRIADPRVNPQSRFVDFAKASGIMLSGGQIPVAVTAARQSLHIGFAMFGTSSMPTSLDADSLFVSGPFQPDLALWMLSGGHTAWSGGKLVPRGHVEHLALAGAAAGYRSMAACLASGRAAVTEVFGGAASVIDDPEISEEYETPEAANMIAPPVAGAPAFLDSGTSLIARAVPGATPVTTRHAQAPSIGDVAASVELELTSPSDVGAVAEERGAPGGDLVASDWTPTGTTPDGTPPFLVSRLGTDAARVHLVVDGKRRFARGALVYANTTAPDPLLAIGVIESEADIGGVALINAKALAETDRFIVEMLDGPSPARIAAS